MSHGIIRAPLFLDDLYHQSPCIKPTKQVFLFLAHQGLPDLIFAPGRNGIAIVPHQLALAPTWELLPPEPPMFFEQFPGFPSRTTVDGSEIRRSPVEVGSLSHYLQDSLRFRWLARFQPKTV